MFLFEIYDKALYEPMNVFIRAYDEYEAEARSKELFSAELYEVYYEDEYTEEEAEILSFDIY